MTEDYLARKVNGRCTRPGCRRRASGESVLCHGHRQAAISYQNRYNRRKRKNRKVCLDCPRKTGEGRYCIRCASRRTARRPRKIRAGEKAGEKKAAIERRTSLDADGRSRFHGQERRGQQPRAQLDKKDIQDAIAALVQADAALDMVRSPGNATLPRMQIKEAVDAVLYVGALGCRLFGDVLLRNGCDPEMLVTVRDDEG